MNANHLQAACIRRYQQHLQRLGRHSTLESAAREWVGRYARLWRQHHQSRQSHRVLMAA